MSYKTVPDVDDGFGDRTSACREYTLFREDPNSRINATIRGQTSIERVLRVRCVLPLLKVISWFVARFLTHFFPHNSLLQVDYSFRCSFFRRVQPLFLRKEDCSMAEQSPFDREVSANPFSVPGSQAHSSVERPMRDTDVFSNTGKPVRGVVSLSNVERLTKSRNGECATFFNGKGKKSV